VKKLFLKFYPTATEGEAESFLLNLRQQVVTVSMAALQGYLLRHKDSAVDAIEQIQGLVNDLENREKDSLGKLKSALANKKKAGDVKPRPVRPLTVEQVDKMFFNPQKDWDKDL
jgi:hypothetical protein